MPSTRRPSRNTSAAHSLEKRLEDRTARLAVIGLGYVGLPLAVEMAQAGFEVVGIDIDEKRVKQLNQGRSYIQDVPTADVRALVTEKRLVATTDFSVLKRCDTVNICVPTPLRKTKDPDMSYIVSACGEIAKFFHPGMLVILESTTYPGTTDEVVLPMLEQGGLKVGKDFFLCFSPERVDPGNAKYNTSNIPKVVGGTTPACSEMGRMFYSQALQKVEPALAIEKIMASGLDRRELVLEPTDPEPNVSVTRQRRYARLKLTKHVPAVTTNLRENMRLTIAELNMGGGIGASDRHLAPGSLLALKFAHGVRSIRAQAIVRGARPQAMAFEFVDMELDERSRLRKLLLELGGLPQPSNVVNRSKRPGRIALMK